MNFKKLCGTFVSSQLLSKAQNLKFIFIPSNLTSTSKVFIKQNNFFTRAQKKFIKIHHENERNFHIHGLSTWSYKFFKLQAEKRKIFMRLNFTITQKMRQKSEWDVLVIIFFLQAERWRSVDGAIGKRRDRESFVFFFMSKLNLLFMQ